MSHSSPARWLAALPAATAFAAAAQNVPPAPADPLPYRSAFEDYQRFEDPPLTAWKQANDIVRERGGWRAYAREAASAPPDAAKPAPSDPHAGHATPPAVPPREKP